MLRGFYANEDTRTPFFVQLVIAAVNIVAAFTLTQDVAPGRWRRCSPSPTASPICVGAVLSTTLLSRAIGPVIDRESVVFAPGSWAPARHGRGCSARSPASTGWASIPTRPARALGVLLAAGALGAVVYVVSARLIGLDLCRMS